MDFKEAKELIIKTGKQHTRREDFTLSGDKEEAYEKIFYYFTNKVEAEKLGLSAKKGLFLFGPVGVGKTKCLEVFNKFFSTTWREVNEQEFNYEFHSFQIITAPEIALKTALDGFKMIYYYASLPLCIDDLGMESPVFNYGTKIDALAELIYLRHRKGCRTHATSNCTPEALENLYGTRIYDRMREMFNFIVFDPDGKSLRG